jgi:hypothetical protein
LTSQWPQIAYSITWHPTIDVVLEPEASNVASVRGFLFKNNKVFLYLSRCKKKKKKKKKKLYLKKREEKRRKAAPNTP